MGNNFHATTKLDHLSTKELRNKFSEEEWKELEFLQSLNSTYFTPLRGIRNRLLCEQMTYDIETIYHFGLAFDIKLLDFRQRITSYNFDQNNMQRQSGVMTGAIKTKKCSDSDFFLCCIRRYPLSEFKKFIRILNDDMNNPEYRTWTAKLMVGLRETYTNLGR